MAKYSVKSNLKHKGRIHEPGKAVELDDETATPLLEAGVVEAAKAEKPAPGKAGK